MPPDPDRQTLPREPARGLVILTCMDARIDPLEAVGVQLGDAHVLRNAGAEATDDVLRGARVSREKLGTHTAIVVAHTDCAGHPSDEAAAEGARRSAAALAQEGFAASAAILDVRTGTLTQLD